MGYQSPNLVQTSSIQGTASPIGTIFRNHTIFSIQGIQETKELQFLLKEQFLLIVATRAVSRPSRNSTYVHFNDAATSTSVVSIDCGWDSRVIYSGNTIVFRITSPPWIPGHSYYVTFDSGKNLFHSYLFFSNSYFINVGVASGTEFCSKYKFRRKIRKREEMKFLEPESSPITNRTFWTFNIWNPSASSTTTTTTIAPTTGTVTTRPISTTTANTLASYINLIIFVELDIICLVDNYWHSWNNYDSSYNNYNCYK